MEIFLTRSNIGLKHQMSTKNKWTQEEEGYLQLLLWYTRMLQGK